MEKVPGGKTGLIVRQIKAVGSGAGMKIVPEYVLDTGLLKELRAHEQQAAGELQSRGDWFLAAITTPSHRQCLTGSTQTEPLRIDSFLDGVLCPRAPRIFRLPAIPIYDFGRRQKGRMARPFGLAPQSALELRPRRALSSAKVSNSVAKNQRQTAQPGRKVASKRHLSIR